MNDRGRNLGLQNCDKAYINRNFGGLHTLEYSANVTCFFFVHPDKTNYISEIILIPIQYIL